MTECPTFHRHSLTCVRADHPSHQRRIRHPRQSQKAGPRGWRLHGLWGHAVRRPPGSASSWPFETEEEREVDVNRGERFQKYCVGSYIGEHPTPRRCCCTQQRQHLLTWNKAPTCSSRPPLSNTQPRGHEVRRHSRGRVWNAGAALPVPASDNWQCYRSREREKVGPGRLTFRGTNN